MIIFQGILFLRPQLSLPSDIIYLESVLGLWWTEVLCILSSYLFLCNACISVSAVHGQKTQSFLTDLASVNMSYNHPIPFSSAAKGSALLLLVYCDVSCCTLLPAHCHQSYEVGLTLVISAICLFHYTVCPWVTICTARQLYIL